MNSLADDFAEGILDAYEAPCLSLYQPTGRHRPENQQDPIRFRNLVKSLEESLRETYPTAEIQLLLQPFMALADDREFWNNTFDGLAVLAARGIFRVYRLQRPVAELAVVAESFHTKPLLRILQSVDRYQVLGLSRQEIKLFEGNRDSLGRDRTGARRPRTITDALGEELTEPHQTVASYGGVGGSHSAMHHGRGGKEPEVQVDMQRWFRAVDRGILEHHSRPSGLPTDPGDVAGASSAVPPSQP